MRQLIVLFLFFATVFQLKAEGRYFTKRSLSFQKGARNTQINKFTGKQNVDFLNYLYNKNDISDYGYVELTGRLRHADVYYIESSFALYNNMVPYCFDAAFTYLIKPKIGVSLGIFSNRLYLSEFNDFYAAVYTDKIISRYIDRQWNFSLMGAYTAATYLLNYETINCEFILEAGYNTYGKFHQKDIIKESGTNYKEVYDYQTKIVLAPFIHPKFILKIDLIKYKKAFLGARFKIAHFITSNAINYKLDRYEWTYDNKNSSVIDMPRHKFTLTDWDIGVFARW